MEQRYSILRDLSGSFTGEPTRARRRLRGLGVDTAGMDSLDRPLSPPEPRIDVETLRPRDAVDIARASDVVSVAPTMPMRLIQPIAGRSEDSDSAWGVHEVRADASMFTGSGATVAILDTGIDAAHPAFQGVTLVQKDFTGSGDGDVVGHGTHCAGTIFGRDVEDKRIGLARGVGTAFIGKVLDDTGGGSSDMLFRGIQWASQQQVGVISMSLGFDFPGMVEDLVQNQQVPVAAATSLALEAYRANLRMFDAIMSTIQAGQAFGRGTVVIAAAGNESQRPAFEVAASLPAAADGVLSVAALEKKESGLGVASFSNTLPQLSAPGFDILSAKAGGGLTAMNGTSMACPHVAGVAALWWEAVIASDLPLNAQVVTNKLLASARPTGFVQGVEVADRGVGIVTAP